LSHETSSSSPRSDSSKLKWSKFGSSHDKEGDDSFVFLDEAKAITAHLIVMANMSEDSTRATAKALGWEIVRGVAPAIALESTYPHGIQDFWSGPPHHVQKFSCS
jgi:hypothetical protein